MPLSECVYCVAVTFKMTELVEQWIWIQLCIKLEHSSMETIQMIQKATAMGNWWLPGSSRQCTCSHVTSCAEIFDEMSNHPGDWTPLQPRFGTLWLLVFPETKITVEREDISDHWWDSGKYNRAADGDSNTGFCRGFWTVEEMLQELWEFPMCLLWRGLRHHCPMYNVSCILYLLQ